MTARPTQVAIVGVGHWGPNLLRNFHNHETCEVSWVVDASARRRELVRLRYPDVKLAERIEEALADPNVDGVVIATPTATHHALALAALEAGKHVLVEKPLATRVDEATELAELAERRGLTLMVGHVFLFNAGVRFIRRSLEERRFGELYYLSMLRTNLGPIRADVDAAWDLAAHDISIANYWVGTEPVAVAAHGGSWINQGTADVVFATLRYPGDVLASIHVSWLSPRKVRDVTVVCEHGMMTFDDMNLTEPVRMYDKEVTDERVDLAFVDSFGSFRTSIREGDIVVPRIQLGEPLKAECDHFVECVRERTKPFADAAGGVAVVRVLAGISRSLVAGGREERV